jgi:hypothetical protein
MGCNQSSSLTLVDDIETNEHGRIRGFTSYKKEQKSEKEGSATSQKSVELRVDPEDLGNFHITISQVKCRNLLASSLNGTLNPYVTFCWDRQEQRTSTSFSTLSPVFEDKFSFFYSCTFRELRVKRLVAKVYDANKIGKDSCLGGASFTLDDIARGPVHYDISLEKVKKMKSTSQSPSDNATLGRLAFNIAARQYGNWPLSFKGIRVLLFQQYLDHTIPADQKPPPDRRFALDYDFTDENHNKIFVHSPAERKPTGIEGLDMAQIVWKGTNLPKISVEDTSFPAVLKGTIHLTVFDHRTYFKPKMITQDSPWGECWLPLDKLYSHSSQNARDGNRQTTFEEGVWFNGTKVGIIEGIFCFDRTPKLAQLVSGVFTEKGLSTASPVIVGTENVSTLRKFLTFHKQNSDGKLPKAVSVLAKLFATVPKLRTYRKNATSSDKLRQKYLKTLRDIFRILRVTEKASMVSFIYESKSTMQAVQELLLSVGKYFLHQLIQGDFNETQFYYRIILSVLRRAELADLALLGFDPLRPTAFNGNNELIDTRALDIVICLRELLIGSLSWCLRKLRFDGHTEETNSFVGHIMAICTLRIPEFGDCLARTLLGSDSIDLHIPEWEHSGGRLGLNKLSQFRRRGSWSKDGGTRGPTRNRSFLPGLDGDPVVLMLDWSMLSEYLIDERAEIIEQQNAQLPHSAFDTTAVLNTVRRAEEMEALGKSYTFSDKPIVYDDFCGNEEEFETATKSRNVERLEVSWVLRMHHKTNIYISFCSAYMEEIFDRIAVVKSDIKYDLLPFYPYVLKSFLLEMNKTTKPTDRLVRLSRTMMANNAVLECMITMLFNKCSVYDVANVTVTLANVRSWLVTMGMWHTRKSFSSFSLKGLNRALLPSSFNYNYFFSAMHILLYPGNLSQVVMTAVEFLYSIWDTIPQQQVDQFVRGLIETGSIVHLMLHWEREVRNFFAHVLAFRIMPDQGWSGEMGSPAVGFEDFIDAGTEDPLFFDIDENGNQIEDTGISVSREQSKLLQEDDEYGRISFDFSTPPDVIEKISSRGSEANGFSLERRRSSRSESLSDTEFPSTYTRNSDVIKTCGALVREIRRRMLVYEENKIGHFGKMLIPADAYFTDNPAGNSENQSSSHTAANFEFAEEFTIDSETKELHPYPGGESKNVLLSLEKVNEDRVILGGSLSGYEIPRIDKNLLVYAKHACQEYTLCCRTAYEVQVGNRSRGDSIPELHFRAVVKDGGEIKPALEVPQMLEQKL